MPRGHEYDPVYSLSIHACFSGQIFLYVFLEKDCNGKRMIIVLCLEVIMVAFFLRNIQ